MYQICCMPPQDQVNSGYLCWQFESGNSPWWKIEHHRAMPTLDIHCLDVNGLHLFPDDRDAELLSRLSRLLVMETIFLLGHSTRRIRDCTSSCWVLMQVPPLQQSAWTTHRQPSSRQLPLRRLTPREPWVPGFPVEFLKKTKKNHANQHT